MPNLIKLFCYDLVLAWMVLCGAMIAPSSAHAAPFTDGDWTSLSPVAGAGGTVQAMMEDGAGSCYIVGSFTAAGGVMAQQVARWDGSTWTALGSGINGEVKALAFSNGVLYAGGQFPEAGGTSASNIARWDGSTWQGLGTGMDGAVHALTFFNGALHAGGTFTTAGGVAASNIARWNGSAWSPLGGGIGLAAEGISPAVHALATDGVSLHVGGNFNTVNGTDPHAPGTVVSRCVARWDGTAWHTMGNIADRPVRALAMHEGQLYAGGQFTSTGPKLARWNGTGWSSVGGSGFNQPVRAQASHDGKLYAGGYFSRIGSATCPGVACWDGATWSAVGGSHGCARRTPPPTTGLAPDGWPAG